MKRLIFLIITLFFALSASAQYCGPYTSHATISLTSVTTTTTISGDSINCANASGIIAIKLTSCSNIHITKCKFVNVQSFAIDLENCSNITVDSCYFSYIGMGLYAHNSSTIKFNANQVENVNGINTSYFGHAVQFDNVTASAGNRIMNNRVYCDSTIAIAPHDLISVYQSSGIVGDSIMITGNYVRGGQIVMNGTGTGGRTGATNGACGITAGDVTGSYQVVRGNYVVNCGYAGIQAIGSSSTGIKIDHNYIYSKQTNISWIGLSIQYPVGSAPGLDVGYNKINWKTYNGAYQNTYDSAAVPANWSTNTPVSTPDASANDTMIPNPLWGSCSLAPIIAYSPTSNTYTVGTAITTWSPSNTGGIATSWAISPSLSSGISFSTSTGNITGTPTVSKASTTYTVSATNTSGTGTATISIIINNSGVAVAVFGIKTH